MLMPKRVKYRKQQRGRLKGDAKGGTTVAFGEWGLKALAPSWITAQQIDAGRIAIMRVLKKGGKIIYEIAGVDEQTAKEALEYAASKLPIPTKIVSRSSFGGEAV